MATYKVPQNVEAEDKLLGPFSFKQFIYLMITAFGVFMAWLFARINGWLVIIPLPFIGVFAILGLYHRPDQPVETYLLAAISFLTKPRKRKWDPEGIVENVRITAPKKIATPAAKKLERGQLERLAHIVDTRGWYLKRPELQEPLADSMLDDDDRLVNPAGQVTSQEPLDIHLTDDVLSPTNPALDGFSNLAEGSHQRARSEAIEHMQAAQKLETRNSKLGGSQLPTNVHYDPYPANITQHQLDPNTGKYQMVDSEANTQPTAPAAEITLRNLSKKATVAHVAQAVNRLSKPKSGQSLDIGAGGEASLRS